MILVIVWSVFQLFTIHCFKHFTFDIHFDEGCFVTDTQPRPQGNVSAASRSPILGVFSEREGPGIAIEDRALFPLLLSASMVTSGENVFSVFLFSFKLISFDGVLLDGPSLKGVVNILYRIVFNSFIRLPSL